MDPIHQWLTSRDEEELPSGEQKFVKAAEGDTLVQDEPNNDDRSGWVLSRKVKIFFAAADIGPIAFGAVMGFYLNPFLLEVAGLAPSSTAILLLVAKLSDAVTDPLIGWASDRTITRWGRRKIWVAPSILPLSAVYVAIWLVPPFSTEGKLGYYFAMLILFSIVVTMCTLPLNALGPELTSDYTERTSLMSYKVLALSLTTIASTFIQSMIVESFFKDGVIPAAQNVSNPLCAGFNVSSIVNGTVVVAPVVDSQLGYLVGSIVFACISIPPLVLLLFCVPEKETRKKKRPTRRDGSVRYKQYSCCQELKAMLTNRAFVCITIIYLFAQLAIQFVQNNLLLYVKYVLRREEWFSYILLVLLSVSCLFLPLWEWLSRRYGKKKMLLLGILLGIVVFFTAFFIRYYTQLAKDIMLWVTIVFGGMCLSALFLLPASMFPDVIEQDELETGQRREGSFYAFFVLGQKIALAVCVAISNVILESVGYVSPEVAGCPSPVQNEEVLLVLSLMIGIFPAAIMAITLIALFFYPITKEIHIATLKELEERKKAKAIITTDGELSRAQEISQGHENDFE